jgi:histidinol-phosphate aminotransferase
MFDVENIVRENIKKLAPYTTARHEFTGTAEIYLDANENALGSGVSLAFASNETLVFNRYPDPNQTKLKEKLSSIKGIPVPNIFIGNGSDEAIDVLLRIFCEPALDNIIICPPTYGMYKVCAHINNVQVREVPLNKAFQLDMEGLQMAINEYTKLIFICSPNNPTGNSISIPDVELLINNFDGIVVIDEAYINYSKQKSLIGLLTEYPNIVILQTLSKAWGLAGLRIGMAFASAAIIEYMNKVKYPYNINEAAQQFALKALDNLPQINEWTKTTIEQRNLLINTLQENNLCQYIYPSDANFILVKFKHARALYNYLCTQGIIVRDRSTIQLIEDCLRITIGISNENEQLITQIKEFYTHPL